MGKRTGGVTCLSPSGHGGAEGMRRDPLVDQCVVNSSVDSLPAVIPGIKMQLSDIKMSWNERNDHGPSHSTSSRVKKEKEGNEIFCCYKFVGVPFVVQLLRVSPLRARITTRTGCSNSLCDFRGMRICDFRGMLHACHVPWAAHHHGLHDITKAAS